MVWSNSIMFISCVQTYQWRTMLQVLHETSQETQLLTTRNVQNPVDTVVTRFMDVRRVGMHCLFPLTSCTLRKRLKLAAPRPDGWNTMRHWMGETESLVMNSWNLDIIGIEIQAKYPIATCLWIKKIQEIWKLLCTQYKHITDVCYGFLFVSSWYIFPQLSDWCSHNLINEKLVSIWNGS